MDRFLHSGEEHTGMDEAYTTTQYAHMMEDSIHSDAMSQSTGSMDMDMMMGGSDGGFCSGDGMVMNNGFEFSFQNGNCVRLLFTSWNLDSAGQYAGGVIAVFCMAVVSELLRYARQSPRLKGGESTRDQFVQSFTYAIQMGLAYGIMLITMTFEAMLFLAIIFGFFVGHFIAGILQKRAKAAARIPVTMAPVTHGDVNSHGQPMKEAQAHGLHTTAVAVATAPAYRVDGDHYGNHEAKSADDSESQRSTGQPPCCALP